MATAFVLTVVVLAVLKFIKAAGIIGEPGRLLFMGMIIIPLALSVRIFRFWRSMIKSGKHQSQKMPPIIDASMWPVVVAFSRNGDSTPSS
jgi:hypothetical protein